MFSKLNPFSHGRETYQSTFTERPYQVKVGFFMIKNNDKEFVLKLIGSKIRRIYKDNCPNCNKIIWRKIDKVGGKCRECAGYINSYKRNSSAKNCEIKTCKNLTYLNPTCRYHTRRIKNIIKIKAREKVRDAVLVGRLKRLPCYECGSLPTVAHHWNYDMPLSVDWLCVKHHKEIHGGKWLAIA